MESGNTLFIIIGISIVVLIIIVSTINKKRKELMDEILKELNLENINSIIPEIDDKIIVKSRQTLNNYTDIKYIKEKNNLSVVQNIIMARKDIENKLSAFLNDNIYKNRSQYNYVQNKLSDYLRLARGYRFLVTYITTAGNNKGSMLIGIDFNRISYFASHPELFMSKTEYNKLLKAKTKESLEAKKHSLYNRVNTIIDFSNSAKIELTIKSKEKELDVLVQKLFDSTVNSIQKISKIDSDEWDMLEKHIDSIDSDIKSIVSDDKQIRDYYNSESFAKLKQTCDLLSQSKREFNEYINEKAQSIASLFGTRIVRNETENEDTYSYIRAYKKSVNPFTAEVSATVFGSAENNPIGYIGKYFYPNKSQYNEQIDKLRLLIEELETLKDAKEIINNYKKEYDQYITEVPAYVLDVDEDGFYSRLGLAVIDESILNVEYKFTYTSPGGMAQRSFTVPMNEDNIAELINFLESKLSMDAQVKEQRALMTTKLRTQIKVRDNYTCCQCGNSIHSEPNLLLEIDHIIPVSKGGLTQEDNLQTLCWKCNRNKGAKLLL